MGTQVLDDALGIFVKVLRKQDLGCQHHVKDLHGVIGHERGTTIHKLIDHYAQGVPVY